LRHLLSATTNVVVAYLIQLLFIFSLDRFTFCVENGLWTDNANFVWFGSNNLKFNCFKIASDNEIVTFLGWSVCILEIGDEVGSSEVSRDAFDGVVKRENMDFGEILNLF
jgi:hypothetical protein